jgi:NAD(P)-dependent dehydrogenase (short-subunit alcohol dehydrogenase family)
MNTETLFSLEGRTALVTGGSRGIGRMIAEGFLRQGARVYVSARKAEPCERTARELSEIGPCFALPADVSTMDGIAALTTRYADVESRLDILVNNAGAAWLAEFDTFPESGWDKVMDLNVKTPFFLTQRLKPLLTAATGEHLAKVINVSSVDGISLNAGETYSYQASKAGLIQLTRRMALRLITDGIVVNGIAPGAFVSDMNIEARDRGDELVHRIPARRIGEPEDMAAAAIYLASRAGDYVVGSTIVVDGGVTHAR